MTGGRITSKAGGLLLGLGLILARPLRADPTEDEKKLQRMQAARTVDGKHQKQVQESMNANMKELSDNQDQHARNIESLKSADAQIAPAQNQEKLAHQSYKDAVEKYGPDHPKSATAKQTLNESRQARSDLKQTREDLKNDIHASGRLVHNEKAVISLQKQVISADSDYLAADDRDIAKKKKSIQAQKTESRDDEKKAKAGN